MGDARSRFANILITLTAAMVLFSIGCRKPGSGDESAESSYDPRTDPLVNPPSMFQPPPEDTSQIDTDQTLVLHLDGNPNTLNPIFGSTTNEFTVVDVLYAGLFTFDKDMKWMVNDDLTESFEESTDHTSFTVKLKPGLTWHDGHPFTAGDVVYSWQQILAPEVPCQTHKPSVEPITECVAIDDRTIRFVQSEPLATRLWNLLFPIIPKHIFEKDKANHPDLKTGDYYNQQARQPIGNGPYRMVEWKENDKIVLERWEDFPGRKPYFKRIVFRIIPDVNIALLSFEKEEIDAIEVLSGQQFARETNTPSFAKIGYKAWGMEWSLGYIGWNMDGSNPFFTDKKVRYAMTHALNIDLIMDKLYYNLASPCYGQYHPDSWMFDPSITRLEYDLEKSRRFLDEAGWLVDSQDGWRYKQVDGQKTRFEFTLLLPQGSPIAPKISAIFQEDLKKIGVEMKTRTAEWSTFVEKIRKHEFQAEIAAWSTGTDPDTGWNLWRTEQYDTGRNYVGYSNEQIDDLFVQGRRE
ncbi:MAG: hypothetical protein KAT00_02550, partial [Planctomycetes bacterium]|nr:hypothetical protein [Planctomycetota bacterium]